MEVIYKDEIKRTSGIIYFIKSGNDGNIKIGITNRELKYMIKELQAESSEKLNILISFRGIKSTEIFLHDQFRIFHNHNEWYSPSPIIFKIIKLIKEGKKLPKL